MPTSRPVSFFCPFRFRRIAAPAALALALLCAAVWIAEAGWGLPVSTVAALKADPLRLGAWWQPVSYAVVHGSLWHLGLNLFVLLLTGSTLERAVGSLRFLALAALAIPAGAVGFLLSLLLDPRLVPAAACVGASAISTALFGAIATLAPREKLTVWIICLPVPFRGAWLLPLLLLLIVAESLFLPGITAYGAHLGGWTAGLLFGAFFREK